MIVCNTTSATRTFVILMAVFITGYICCPISVFSQEKEDYWLISVKHNKYKILPQNKLDTITISTKDLKQNLCIAFKSAKADKNNKVVIIMTNARQVLGKFPLKNGKVTVAMAMFSNVTDNIVSINVVQQPKSPAIGIRARLGTKLICYLNW